MPVNILWNACLQQNRHKDLIEELERFVVTNRGDGQDGGILFVNRRRDASLRSAWQNENASLSFDAFRACLNFLQHYFESAF